MTASRLLALCLLTVGSSAVAVGQTQLPPPSPGKARPKLQAVAETKLLMDGLAHANFRGLEKHLAQKPDDPQTWSFARGQALLIAETGNLLMLRPPRSQGQDAWFEHATDLRGKATQLAQVLAKRDYLESRAAFVQLANSCNRCHQAFRVNVEIEPFAQATPPPKTE
jgi:hypothetical protein